MQRTIFFRRFNRGLPRTARIALFIAVVLALLSYASSSLMADPRIASTPVVVPQWTVPAVEGEWISSPRECDLPAGLSTDCVFMD
ncbi:hypothetical protein DSM104443_02342 [Usitatibacter rugosus]|uniref:Uncharacterized protein n=1 Tax=Usitatibacter rugosus TaxID=2732067 RepID=A0A6M4GVH8_9PROT|nr:hypothetical protein [Usitatibacter rugosus]QJR11269.1 hypothetical protein DSM104443_02342 [Usitatibacter rugosus]